MNKPDPDKQHNLNNCENCEFIIDIHFDDHVTHIWTKTMKGKTKHYPLHYHPRIYIAQALPETIYQYNQDELLEIARVVAIHPEVISVKIIDCYLNSKSDNITKAVEIELYSIKSMSSVVEDFKKKNYYLYNVDINKRQHFFLDTDSYPLGTCHINLQGPYDGLHYRFEPIASRGEKYRNDYQPIEDTVELELDNPISMYDDVSKIDYFIPTLRILKVDPIIKRKGAFETVDDELEGLKLEYGHYVDSELCVVEKLTIGKKSNGRATTEKEILLQLVEYIHRYDMDILLLPQGDKFTLNYLAHRAQFSDITDQFILGRLNKPQYPQKKRQSQVYMVYGQILNKTAVSYLPGRIHLDYDNSFILYEGELAGVIDLSRMSATPIERTARASIGTTLTGIEFVISQNTTPKTLVPENKVGGEQFKDSDVLMIADNGGLTYPAVAGVYDQVWAMDFTSLYPMIMMKHNIGSETVLCEHEDCRDKNIVPELGYHVCVKRVSVVTKTMKLILSKRVAMKHLKKVLKDDKRSERYRGMDSALKWILVCCFEGSTRVFVRKNGVYLSDRLDTIVNEYTGTDKLEVLGMSKQGQPEFKPVKDVIKVRPQTPVFRIQFQGGKTAVATADHLWPVITKNGWENVRTDQLTKDHWIPQLEQFDITPNCEELDIIEELVSNLTDYEMTSWRIRGEILVDVLHESYERIKQVATAEYTIQSINKWKQKGMIPLKYWSLIKSELTDSQLYIGSGKRGGGLVQWLNARIPLSKDLGFFLGFLLGDGSIGNTIRFAVGSEDHDLIEELCKIIPRIWNIEAKIYEETSANMVNVQINSRALSYILKNIFGITGRATKRTLSVPKIVWNAPIEVAQGFLAGLFAADGSVGTDRLFVCFNTVQKSFAEEIGMLCTRVGLVYCLYTEGEMCKVELRDDRYIILLESFGFVCSKHKEKMELHRQNRQQVRYNEWPTMTSGLLDLARKTKKTRSPRVTQRDAISKLVLSEKLKQIRDVSNKLSDVEIQCLERLEVLAEAPMHFSRVVKVKQLENAPDYVYCLQLDSSTPWFMIQGGLITHNCFGYLGFKNSRWGSIESHQCVTSYGRRYLLQARMIVEKFGFKVIAGLTDSLFIQAVRKGANNRETINKLVYAISKETNIPMDVEGRFNWVVFCNVKDYPKVAALNRYFGYFDHNELKLRGIRTRQRSVTGLEDTFQREILEVLSKAKTLENFTEKIYEAVKILENWKTRLRSRKVNAHDLIFKIKSHVGSGNYKSRTQQAIAAQNYVDEGKEVEQGHSILYLVRDDRRRDSRRVTIGPRVEEMSEYDVEWYCKVLDKAFLELLEAPQKQLLGRIRYGKPDSYEDLSEWIEIEN
ncbi:MAG: DNA polymerase domain-containing protein [Candidatus Kariarchaeaceae archaeon]|jgi:DNA polymerase elongation subunit (family B)